MKSNSSNISNITTPQLESSFNSDVLPGNFQFQVPSTDSCRKELEYSTNSKFSSNVSPTQLQFTPKSNRTSPIPSTPPSKNSTSKKRKRAEFDSDLPSIDEDHSDLEHTPKRRRTKNKNRNNSNNNNEINDNGSNNNNQKEEINQTSSCVVMYL